MVDFYGRAYIIDYALSFVDMEKKNEAYQIYIAECLRLLLENVARSTGGKCITAKWYDIINNNEEENEDNRTGDEIAADVIKRMGLSFGGESA